MASYDLFCCFAGCLEEADVQSTHLVEEEVGISLICSFSPPRVLGSSELS